MSERPERVLSDFVDAWARGEHPQAEEYLARAEPDEQDDLAGQLDTFLAAAPTPGYAREAQQELEARPEVREIVSALQGESGLWPVLLPRLRDRARLRRSEVVRRLREGLGLPPQAEQKTGVYLHRMEQGLLPAEGVSQRVLDVLGRVLGASPAGLRDAGRVESLGGGDTAAGLGMAFAREARLADAAEGEAAPQAREAEQWDEVDRLFRGGD